MQLWNNHYEIYNIKTNINISIGKDKVDAVNDYLNEFEKILSEKLREIFDKNLPFIETEDKDNCKFCAYKNLCGN